MGSNLIQMIPNTFIAELRDRTDITALISGYTQLKRSGRGLVGLCPFHTEKTPSFTVYPDSASFYCYGCHKGGDAITFVRDIENLDYVGAVRFLADRAGLDMPEDGAVDGLAEIKRRLKEMHRDAARFFYKKLYSPQGRHALDYLHGRGMSDEAITHFGVGWSPDSWDELSKHLASLGYKDEEMTSGNLAFKNRFDKLTDRFRDRIMFPIIDVQGSVIGFGGRTMKPKEDGKPYSKYLNTSDTPIYKKSKNLYALNWAKNTRERKDGERIIIVTEGFMDVIALWQAGIDNAVAAQGTAFTKEQAQLLAQYSKQIVLSQDGDAAGQKAIKASIPVLKSAGINVRVLTIPDGMDPDEYIRAHGADRMKLLLSGGIGDTEYLLNNAASGIDTTVPDGRVEYLRRVCNVLEGLSPIEREVYAGRVAEQLHIEKSAILSQLHTQDRKRQYEQKREQLETMEKVMTGAQDKLDPERRHHLRAARAEETLLAMLLAEPSEIAKTAEKLPPEGFVTPFNTRLYSLLIELERTGERPSLMLMSARLTPEEMSSATRVFSGGGSPVPNDTGTLASCIEIIKEEKTRLTGDEVGKASGDDLQKYLEALAKKKK